MKEQPLPLIDMNKQYQTRNGKPVRLLCTDSPDPKYPVVGIVDTDVQTWSATGEYEYGLNLPNVEFDLIEISPYSDWEIDTPVWVRESIRWYPRYFAGIDELGRPLTWDGGTTSFSNTDKDFGLVPWDKARKASEFTPPENKRDA